MQVVYLGPRLSSQPSLSLGPRYREPVSRFVFSVPFYFPSFSSSGSFLSKISFSFPFSFPMVFSTQTDPKTEASASFFPLSFLSRPLCLRIFQVELGSLVAPGTDRAAHVSELPHALSQTRPYPHFVHTSLISLSLFPFFNSKISLFHFSRSFALRLAGNVA